MKKSSYFAENARKAIGQKDSIGGIINYWKAYKKLSYPIIGRLKDSRKANMILLASQTCKEELDKQRINFSKEHPLVKKIVRSLKWSIWWERLKKSDRAEDLVDSLKELLS